MDPSGGARFVRVDIRSLGQKRAANYAAKYVAKDFGEQLPKGTHRYVASHGLVSPQTHRIGTAELCRIVRSGIILGRGVGEYTLTSAYDGRRDGKPFLWLAFDTG